MAGMVLPSIGRVRLTDLIASEGIPSETYKVSVSTLMHSLARSSAVIVQLPPSDGALLKSGLESAHLFFHQREYSAAEMVHTSDSRERCRTSGYYSDPQSWQEIYDNRPGLTPTEPNGTMEFPPAGLPDIFALLGKAARCISEAISFSLNLQSFSFSEILDNIPLRNTEISSSVLSVCCHSRPSFQGAQHQNLTTTEGRQLVMFSDHEHQVDKRLLTLVKSDRSGLHTKDFHGHLMLIEGGIGPQDAIVYPGLALYQATAGCVNAALYCTEMSNLHANMYGQHSLAFKLMPRSMASLSSSEIRAAGYGVDAQFQLPIPVDDFMQRSHPTEQLFSKQIFPSYTFRAGQDGYSLNGVGDHLSLSLRLRLTSNGAAALKPMVKRKKSST